MNINFAPITDAQQYIEDKKKLTTTGRQRARNIYLYVFLAMTIVALPYLLIKLVRFLERSTVESSKRNAAISQFAQQNGFQYTGFKGGIERIDESRVWRNLPLPYNVDHIVPFNSLSGITNGHPFTYSFSSVMVKSGN